MKKAIAFIVLFLIVYVSTASAWWSATIGINTTHHNLIDSARKLVNSTDYPDIAKFGNDVSDWTSGTKDDARAHNPNSDDPTTVLSTLLDGKPIGDWWKKAKQQYEQYNYNSGDWSAYYYIALMMHLTEDQAVLAHAYNIKHGTPGYMDNLEQMADSNYNPNSYGVVNADSPSSNYSAMIYYTRDRTLSTDSSSYWWSYWQYDNLASNPSCTSNGDSTYGYYGVYGGAPLTGEGQENSGYYGCPSDVFPALWSLSGNNEQSLEKDLLGQAVSYTAGALIAASMNLPPLTKNFSIDGSSSGTPEIDTANGSSITFTMYENRLPDVYVIITVDSADGTAIMDADTGTAVSYLERDLGSGTDLPYEGPFTAKWKGALADGSIVSSGTHTLYATLYDHDGNKSPVYTINFTIQTPPQVSSTLPADGATNVSQTSPITLTFSKDMNTATATNSSIDISPKISGSSFSWSDSKTLSIALPSSGLSANTTYIVTVYDSLKDTDGTQLDEDKDGKAGSIC